MNFDAILSQLRGIQRRRSEEKARIQAARKEKEKKEVQGSEKRISSLHKVIIGDDLVTVLAVLAAVSLLKNEPKRLDQIEKEIGARGRLHLRERIRSLQAYFGKELISIGKTTAPSHLGRDALDEGVLSQLERIVANFSSGTERHAKPQILIGGGVALVADFVHEVVRRARLSDQGREKHFDVRVRSYKPNDLKELVDSGVLDLAVTSFSKEEIPQYSSDNLRVHNLPMYLLVDRRYAGTLGRSNKNSLSLRDLQESLAGMTIAIPSIQQWPHLRFPTERLPNTAQIERFRSWHDGLSMTLCEGDVCCAAFPQIFPVSMRSRFREFRLAGTEFPEMHLGVLRPRASIEMNSPEHNEIVELLWESFDEEVERVATEHSRSLANLFPQNLRKTAHISRCNTESRTSGTENDGDRSWLHGRLEHFAITPSGFLRADHIFNGPRGTEEFAISGQITGEKRTRHVVWRGRDRKADTTAETYTLAIHAKDPTKGAPFIGIWSGWATWTAEKRPDIGYFVIYPNDRTMTDDDLNNLVDQFEESIGGRPSLGTTRTSKVKK